MSKAKAEDIEIRTGPDDQVVLRALDPATVAFSTATINELLDGEMFEVEKVHLNLDQIYGIMRKVSGSASVVVETIDAGRKMIISTANSRYGLQTLAPESIREFTDPTRSARRPLVLTGGEFFEMVTGASTVSDVITLNHPVLSEDGVVQLVGRGGGSITEFEYRIQAWKPDKAEDVGRGSYPLDYLTRLAAVLKTTDVVHIVLGDDVPLHISAELELGLDVTALIAPRLRLE